MLRTSLFAIIVYSSRTFYFVFALIPIILWHGCDDGGTGGSYDLFIFYVQVVDSIDSTPIDHAYFGNKVVPDSVVFIGDSVIVDDPPDGGDKGNFRSPEGYTEKNGRGHYFMAFDRDGIQLRDFLVYKPEYRPWRYNPTVHRVHKVDPFIDSLFVRLARK